MRISKSPILPCGKVNLQTGKFKYGNIYGFWGNNTTYEVYETDENKLRVVATAGDKPIVPLGERSSFQHDQTGKYLFTGTVVDVVHGNAGLKTLPEKFKKTMAFACYK